MDKYYIPLFCIDMIANTCHDPEAALTNLC